MKKCIVIIITLMTALALSGCCLSHNWVEATCTEPKTCSVCGETEGEALGHKWVEATCTVPKICSVCGETEGEALGHKWKVTTYKEPKVCSRCNEAEAIESFLEVLNNNTTKEEVISIFGDDYEGTEREMTYKDVDCFGYKGDLFIYWLDEYCVPSWECVVEKDAVDVVEKRITDSINEECGVSEKAYLTYTWDDKASRVIQLRVNYNSAVLSVTPNDDQYNRLQKKYKDGLGLIADGSYTKGRTKLEELGAFDVNGKDVLDAMYQYVKKHTSMKYNNTFFDYISKLSRLDYKDTKELYHSLYDWRITVTGISTAKNSVIIEDTLTTKDTVYFSVDLTGGEPNAKTKIKCVTTYPGGKIGTDVTEDEWDRTWTGWFSAYNMNTEGVLTKDFYDDQGDPVKVCVIDIL